MQRNPRFSFSSTAPTRCATGFLTVIDSLKMIAGGKVSTNDIAGPVRIVTIIDQTVEENTQYGFVTVVMNLLNLMVMFSANLGVMNLLPFPALDGGRLVFPALGARDETSGEPESRGRSQYGRDGASHDIYGICHL